jgi:predicted dehydrogenase
MTQALRIGLLGASRIAPKAVIAPARARDDVVISAVAARDPARARAYAAEHGIAVAVGGYAELVARDDVDVVYCALAPADHLQACLQAIEAGKALLIEKPFSKNAREAREIAAAAAKAGRPALEAFHYRFHSMFGRALDIVASGALGRLRSAEGLFEAEISRREGELRWNPALGGGGTMDLGCYVLHALRILVGAEPQVASARAEVQDGVDAVMEAELVFPDGVAARTRSSMLGPRQDWIVLEGTLGTLRLDSFVSPQRGGRLTLTTAAGVREEAAEGPGSYDAQLEHLVQVMAGEAPPLTGGEDAVATMALLDAVRTAAGLGALL